MLSSYGPCPQTQFVCDRCLRLSWISSALCALSPRYTAPPQTLINHSTHWVTFALFKKILQTLAFPKSNYLPFHISAANIPALWSVYLMVFVYGLTFFSFLFFPPIFYILIFLKYRRQLVLVFVSQSAERETSDVLSMMLILKSWQQ